MLYFDLAQGAQAPHPHMKQHMDDAPSKLKDPEFPFPDAIVRFKNLLGYTDHAARPNYARMILWIGSAFQRKN